MPVLKLAEDMGVDSYGGSEDDVLDRYYRQLVSLLPLSSCASPTNAPHNPKIVDMVVRRFIEGA
jgi:spore coat polysaccharide biosynthesis protein SpsF (cytidylyltransferase family)